MIWSSADSLLISLLANDGQLGKLVKSLEGIVDVGAHLAKHGHRVEENFDRSRKWYLDVVNVCLNSEHFDLWLYQPGMGTWKSEPAFESASHLELVEQALVGNRYVKTLSVQSQEVDINDLNTILLLPSLSNVSSIRLANLEIYGYLVTRSPLTRGLVENMRPEVRFLQVDFGSFAQGATHRFINTLSSSPLHLSITSNSSLVRHHCLPILDVYNRHHDSTASAWSGDSFLSSSLDNVASSDPRIQIIDLHDIIWLSTHSSRSDETIQNFISRHCCEERLRQVFSKFTELKRVDLGVLPTTDKNGYALLRGELEDRGVEVSWKYCRSSKWCENCEKEHD